MEAEGNQEQGERDDENALQDLVARRAGHAAHEEVETDDRRESEVELPRLDVRNRRMQALGGVEVGELVEVGPLLRCHLRRLGVFEAAVLAELFHLVLLRDRVRGRGFGQQRGGDVVADQVGPPDEEDDVRHLVERVELGQIAAAETLVEQLGDGHQPHAPKPHVHEPIVGVHEHGLKRLPGPGGALLVDQRRRAHGAVGVRRVAEIQEELVELSQLPAGEKIALLALGVRGRPLAEVQDEGKVDGNDQQIDQMNATHGVPGMTGPMTSGAIIGSAVGAA